jgi:hypothetical protein
MISLQNFRDHDFMVLFAKETIFSSSTRDDFSHATFEASASFFARDVFGLIRYDLTEQRPSLPVKLAKLQLLDWKIVSL